MEEILINKEWLNHLIDLGREVSKDKMVKISSINYLLGYIESAELLTTPSGEGKR